MARSVGTKKSKNPGAPHSQSSRRKSRREEAEARKAAHDELTPAQKLGKLDQKFGFAKGARRERARLALMRDPIAQAALRSRAS